MQARASDSYVETNGARLRYRDEGEGTALLLVHGWTLDLDQWEPQAVELAGEFRVVRLDRRGFGLSSGRPSITGDGADLAALCEHLRLESVALVGMSQGTRAVLQFAASYPGLTSCVILDGPPHLGAPDATDSSPDLPYEYYCELARTRGLPAFRREWSEHALARLRTSDPETQARLARMIARYPGWDLIDTAAKANANAARPDRGFASVDRPVLVMNGEFDLESRRRSAKHIAAQLPRAERVEIPQAGHLCNLDNPRAYNEALRRFLQRHTIPSIPRSVP